MYSKMNEFIDLVKIKNPNEHEFHQAVHEVIESIWDFVLDNPQYQYNSSVPESRRSAGKPD